MELVLKKTIYVASVCVITYFMIMGYVYAGEDCVFDKAYFSSERYKNNSLINCMVWNDQDNIANILMSNGAIVSVKHWSCNHLGLEAKQFLFPISQYREYDLKREILTLGKIVLENYDYKIFERKVTKVVEIKSISKIDIPETTYSEFYVSIEKLSESIIITIKYYRD